MSIIFARIKTQQKFELLSILLYKESKIYLERLKTKIIY